MLLKLTPIAYNKTLQTRGVFIMTQSKTSTFYEQVKNINVGNGDYTIETAENHKYQEELEFLQEFIVQNAKYGLKLFTTWHTAIFFNGLTYAKTKTKMNVYTRFFKKLGFDCKVVTDDTNKRCYLDIRWELN